MLQTDLWEGDIITNPPYKFATEFVQHALHLIPNGHKVAMFLKITFLEGTRRYQQIFKTQQLKSVYVATKRLHCMFNGEQSTGNMMTFAWYVWEKGYKGEPTIRWINTPEEDKEESLF